MGTGYYAIAIIPDAKVVEQITTLKKEIEKIIGWFPGKESIPILTIGEFEASSEALQHIHHVITNTCQQTERFPITLNKLIKDDDSGSIYIALDDSSDIAIVNLQKLLHQRLNFKKQKEEPNITVGELLSESKLNLCLDKLKLSPIKFQCNSVVLKRFNTDLQHYELLEKYPFI